MFQKASLLWPDRDSRLKIPIWYYACLELGFWFNVASETRPSCEAWSWSQSTVVSVYIQKFGLGHYLVRIYWQPASSHLKQMPWILLSPNSNKKSSWRRWWSRKRLWTFFPVATSNKLKCQAIVVISIKTSDPPFSSLLVFYSLHINLTGKVRTGFYLQRPWNELGDVRFVSVSSHHSVSLPAP